MTAIDGSTSLEALVQQVMVDPAGLIDSVLRLVLPQAPDGARAQNGGGPEELLASAVGQWITNAMNEADGAALPPPLPDERGPGAYDEFANRNSRLAAALGACDCWGEDVDCPFCDGFGAPAWIAPDRRLFADYVYPAVRALAIRQRSRRSSTAHGRNGELT